MLSNKLHFFASFLFIAALSSCASAQGIKDENTDNSAIASAIPNSSPLTTSSGSTVVAGKRSAIVEEAKKLLGSPYRMGSIGPNAFDCSGFVYYVAREAALLQLPRTSQAMKEKSTMISEGSLLPGDLLFFKTVAPGKISHVGIYIGGGKFIHAASDGPETGVIISSIMDRYWKMHYDCAGRVLFDADE